MLDHIALDAAHKINDEMVRSHEGGVAQRTARIQIIVRDAIVEAMNVATRGMTAAQSQQSG